MVITILIFSKTSASFQDSLHRAKNFDDFLKTITNRYKKPLDFKFVTLKKPLQFDKLFLVQNTLPKHTKMRKYFFKTFKINKSIFLA